MISCTEFIPLYSELFKYLEDKVGHGAVVKYWEYISDTYVADLLGKAVDGKGVRGCWDYWSKSLNEEACDFRMELDEEKGTFSIDLRYCPSRGMLNSLSHIEPYYDYCGHCDVLYSRQLKKYGIECILSDHSRIENAACTLKYKCSAEYTKNNESREKLVMDVKASENEYFHRDFHISGMRGIEYVGRNYGDNAVREYLSRFAKAYYSPLIVKIKEDGLSALRSHIEGIYAAEKSSENVKCELSEKELKVTVSECPAVKYIRESGNSPTKWYVETTQTVSRAIAEEAGLAFEMLSYNSENGAAIYRFLTK